MCGVLGEVGPDGNVTKIVNVPTLEEYHKYTKSIHSSNGVIDFSFHEAKGSRCMLPGYERVEMPTITLSILHTIAKKRIVDE